MKNLFFKMINTIIAVAIFWGIFIGVHYLIAFLCDKISVYFLTFVIIPFLVMLCAIVD